MQKYHWLQGFVSRRNIYNIIFVRLLHTLFKNLIHNFGNFWVKEMCLKQLHVQNCVLKSYPFRPFAFVPKMTTTISFIPFSDVFCWNFGPFCLRSEQLAMRGKKSLLNFYHFCVVHIIFACLRARQRNLNRGFPKIFLGSVSQLSRSGADATLRKPPTMFHRVLWDSTTFYGAKGATRLF